MRKRKIAAIKSIFTSLFLKTMYNERNAKSKRIGALAKAIKDVDVDKLKQMNASLAILGGTMAVILVAE